MIRHYNILFNVCRLLGLPFNFSQNIIDFENDKFEDALEKIDLALQFDKISAFHDLKGDILIGMKEIGKALSNYRKAYKIAKTANDKNQQFDSSLKIYEIERRIGSEKAIEKAKNDVAEVNTDFDLYNKKISSRTNSILRVRTQKLDIKVMKLIETNVVKIEKNTIESSDENSPTDEKGDTN